MKRSSITLLIHKEGYKFIGISLAISFLLLFFSSTLFWLGICLTLGLALFFRNPSRVVPNDENLIVSPVDGTVCAISFDSPPIEYEIGTEKRYKVSIFLSLLNVHVNRIPVAGKIKKVIYSPGQFINAALDKSSLFNERNVIVIEANGNEQKIMTFSQIAGTIARRIVCDIHDGQDVKKGEVFGLIRFGSRSDIWLPVGSIPQVYVGQSTIAGETIIADLSAEKASLREGTIVL